MTAQMSLGIRGNCSIFASAAVCCVAYVRRLSESANTYFGALYVLDGIVICRDQENPASQFWTKTFLIGEDFSEAVVIDV